MVEVGIDTVRVGEFLWSRLESREGRIDLSLLDAVFSAATSRGLSVVLCTPTVTPPVWFTHGHPERMHVDSRGVTMGHGGRQHACLHHPRFRKRVARIVHALAERFGRHPSLVLWQLDNELKSQATECHCPTCRKRWHHWLARRYGTIAALNEAWGTGVFSQTYQRFDQVPTPGDPQPFLHNASLTTAYRTFSHEGVVEFAAFQAKILRTFSTVPVTTNGSVGFSVNNHTLFQVLDTASYDTYADQTNSGTFVFNLDFWRSFGPRPFWLIETSPSHTGALERNSSVHPSGYLAAEAALTWAQGGEAFCYWLWRQHRHGCELSHGAVISASGAPAAGWDDVAQVSRIRDTLAPIVTTTRLEPARAAITWSEEARAFWATEPQRGVDYRGRMTRVHGAFHRRNLARDVVSVTTPLDGYRLLMTAFLPAPEALVDRALAWVWAGGTWIVGPSTGGRTPEHGVEDRAVLHPLIEQAAGAKALYTYPAEGSGASVEGLGVSAPLESMVTVLQPLTAQTLAVMRGGRDSGAALVTEATWGQGKVVLVGGCPGPTGDGFLEALVGHYAARCGIRAPAEADPGLVCVVRAGDARTLVVVDVGGSGGQVRVNGTVETVEGFGCRTWALSAQEEGR